MDIPAFVHLLATESLTFVRADLFEDKFEGTLPKLTANLLDEEMRKRINDGEINKKYWNFSEILNKINKSTYLNCWCKENFEMVHMWKIYSKESGVGIRTTYSDLKDSIKSREKVYPTESNYLDFDRDFFDWKSNAITPYTIKRKEYKSENEFRMLISHPRFVEDQLLGLERDFDISSEREELYSKTDVIPCEVDIKKIISKVHLSPYAPAWYMEIVKELLTNFNLKKVEILKSEL